MNIIISIATKENIDEAIKLSKLSRLIVKNGKVEKLGIYKPIYKKNLKNIYVATDENGRVIAAVEVNLLKKEDYEIYETNLQEKPIMIGKFCVDESFRKKHIASRLIEKIKQDFKECVLYAEVLLAPTENTPSLKMMLANGFKIYKNIDWYHKDFDATFTWGFLKC